ncbi:WD40 repeat-like protein, partial [Rhizopogon vinicolor AM-OR11-026]
MSSRNAEMNETSMIKPCQTMRGHTDAVWSVAHLPGRRQIITCSGDGSLRLWDTESGAQIGDEWRDEGGNAGVTTIALSPNGKTVASGSRDGKVTLWDVERRKVFARWTGHSEMVRSVCWSDGEHVLSGSDDGTVRVWDVETGKTALGPIKTKHKIVYAAIYSHDTTKIATGGKEDGIKIWDANTGELRSKIQHRETVWNLAWTSDQKKLIAGSYDGSITIFDTATRKQTAILEDRQGGVFALCLFQNDRLLASTLGKSASLWNLETNHQVGQPLQHEVYVNGSAFSPDGKLLATGCLDNNAYIWDIHAMLKGAGLEDLLSFPNVPRNGLEQQADATRQVQHEERHPEPPSSSFVNVDATNPFVRPQGNDNPYDNFFHSSQTSTPSHPSRERRLWNTRIPEGNVGGGDDDDAECDMDVGRSRKNDKGTDQQVLPAAHDNNDNRNVWKSLMRARGKDISFNYDEEENGRDEDKLRQKEDDGQRKASTLPYSESTATEAQTCQESTDVSDSLQDLTNHLQGRSDYPIASGGFGDIWKCELVKANETVEVAVKTIRAFDAGNDILVRKNSKRVRRELKVWGRLKHDCILPLWGVANNFGRYPAMICPWVKNGSLTGFLEREQDTLSSQDKFSLLNDIALGLQYLHDKTIVHGDLTGSNVLVHG